MIPSLLNKPEEPDESGAEDPVDESTVEDPVEEKPPAAETDDTLLEALPVAEKIIFSRRFLLLPAEGEDLLQTVALRLFKWQGKYPEKGARMTIQERLSFTARTTFNEINRFLAKRTAKREILVGDFSELPGAGRVVGETETELMSLTLELWKNMRKLSVKQRQALLLGNRELSTLIMRLDIDDGEMSVSLGIGKDWKSIKHKLPLKDAEIAVLLQRNGESKKSIEQLVGSIKKARYDARLKLGRISGYE